MIPDSLFMKIQGKTTVLEIWNTLKKEFQNKSKMVSVDGYNRNAVPTRAMCGVTSLSCAQCVRTWLLWEAPLVRMNSM